MSLQSQEWARRSLANITMITDYHVYDELIKHDELMSMINSAVGDTVTRVFAFPRVKLHNLMLFDAPHRGLGLINSLKSGRTIGPQVL